jgi:hypothetical protein
MTFTDTEKGTIEVCNDSPNVWEGFRNKETHAAAADAVLLHSLQRATHSLSELVDFDRKIVLLFAAVTPISIT